MGDALWVCSSRRLGRESRGFSKVFIFCRECRYSIGNNVCWLPWSYICIRWTHFGVVAIWWRVRASAFEVLFFSFFSFICLGKFLANWASFLWGYMITYVHFIITVTALVVRTTPLTAITTNVWPSW